MWTLPEQKSHSTKILSHIINKFDTLTATLEDEKLVMQAKELRSSFEDLITIWQPKGEEK